MEVYDAKHFRILRTLLVIVWNHLIVRSISSLRVGFTMCIIIFTCTLHPVLIAVLADFSNELTGLRQRAALSEQEKRADTRRRGLLLLPVFVISYRDDISLPM